MADELTLAFSISFMVNVALLIIFMWRRGEILLAFNELIHRHKAKRVRIIRNGGIVKTVIVQSVKDFDWQSGMWDKFFKKDIQKQLNQPVLPPKSYLVDEDTGRPEYEFFEDSTVAVDPYSRKPNLEQLKNQRRNYVGAYNAAYLKARMGVKDNLSWIIIVGLALVGLISIAGAAMINQLTERTTTDFENVHTHLDDVPVVTFRLIDQNLSSPLQNRLVPVGGSPNE